MKKIILKTERLILKPVTMAYFNQIHVYASDPDNTTYMLFLPNLSEQETINFIKDAENEWQKENPSYYEFSIEFENQIIGGIGVYISENDVTEGELGWLLNKKFQGKGFATEAALSIKDFCKKELGLSRLFATCDSRNIASINVMKKLGMTLEDDKGFRKYLKKDMTGPESRYGMKL